MAFTCPNTCQPFPTLTNTVSRFKVDDSTGKETGEQLVLKRPVVVERLKWRRSMCAEEWVYLRSRKARPGKVTMISAQQAAAYYDPEKSRAAYSSRDAYLADIVDFSRHEVEEL